MPALFIGCMLSNITSPYFLYDVFVGSSVTLVAAFGSYTVGWFFKKDGIKLLLGGLFPVLLNAFFIPLIIVFLCGDLAGAQTAGGAYALFVGSFLLTETVWVYGLGTPLYYAVKRLQPR